MSLGANDLQECPSPARRRTHRAHGMICAVCEPDEERPARCPLCLDTVTAVGDTVQPHEYGGRGHGVPRRPCPGSGSTVAIPVLVDRQIQFGRRAGSGRRSRPAAAPGGAA